MWDLVTLKSKGYGFVAFSSQSEAEKVLETMNGLKIGSRAVRVNWATQKNARKVVPDMNLSCGVLLLSHCADASQGYPLYSPSFNHPTEHSFNSTVYIGNLSHETMGNSCFFSSIDYDILPLLQSFGYVVNFSLQAHRGFAFAKMDSPQAASLAIASLHGSMIKDKPVRVSWGKERLGNHPSPSTGSPRSSPAGSMYPVYPMYGFPGYYGYTYGSQTPSTVGFPSGSSTPAETSNKRVSLELLDKVFQELS